MAPMEIKLNIAMNKTMLAIDSRLDGARCEGFVAAPLALKAVVGDFGGVLVRLLSAMNVKQSIA